MTYFYVLYFCWFASSRVKNVTILSDWNKVYVKFFRKFTKELRLFHTIVHNSENKNDIQALDRNQTSKKALDIYS